MLFLLKCLASGSLFFHPAQEKVILVTAVSPSQALSDNAPHPTSSQPLGLCVFQQAISEVGPLGWRDRNAPQWEATDGSVALLKLTALPIPLAFLRVYSAAWSAQVFPSCDRVHPMQRCGEEIPVVLPGASWKGAECRALYQWWGCVNKLIELCFKGVRVSGALFTDVCLAWDGATAREWCLREVGHFCPGKSHPSVHWGGPLLNLVTYSTPYKNYAKGLFFRKRGFFFVIAIWRTTELPMW